MNYDVVINAGHGGKDPGAQASDGRLEKDMALEASLYQFNRLVELGLDKSKILMTRTTDITNDLNQVASSVAKSNAKICISNHFNSASAINAKGFEVLVSYKNNQVTANKIIGNVKTLVPGVTIRGIKTRKNTNGEDYFAMHRSTGNVETLIVEYAFINNKEELKLYDNNKVKFLESVIKAVCEKIGVQYKEPVKVVEVKAPEISFKDMVILQAEELGLISKGQHKATEPAEKWFVLQVIMNAMNKKE